MTFVREAIGAISLVAGTFGRQVVGTGDEVPATGMEHHANLIPWQQLCRGRGARLRAVPIGGRGETCWSVGGRSRRPAPGRRSRPWPCRSATWRGLDTD